MLLPRERVLNSRLSGAAHGDVVKIEVLPVQVGDRVSVRFLGTSSPWRQGIWLAAGGVLSVADQRVPQVVLWTDTAPGEVEMTIIETDGFLRFYNVWDSGRRLGPFESQSATSGMLVEGGVYKCSDIASEPAFDRLTFSLAVVSR